MAPKTGAKRAQQTKEVPMKKKQKSECRFKPIIEGIGQADALNDSCRKMLVAAVPSSLGTASDLRHESQHVMVKMIGEALAEVAASMHRAFDEQNAKLEDFESSRSSLTSKLKEAQDALTEAENIVQSKKSALADKTQSFQHAKAALQEKLAVQRAGDIADDEATKLKSALDKIIDCDLKATVEGELADADADVHYKALQPFFSDLTLDDSLKTALPITCVKPKSRRGFFDNMVIDELSKCFFKRSTELSQMLAEVPARKAERDAVVQAAEEHTKDAEDLQSKAAEELASANDCATHAAEDVKLAEAEVIAYEPVRLKLVGEKDARAATLENFKQYSLACFERLRDQASKPFAAAQVNVEITKESDEVAQPHITQAKSDTVVEETRAEAPAAVGGA